MTIQYSEYRRQLIKLTDDELQQEEDRVINQQDKNWAYLQNEDPTDLACKDEIKELNKLRQRIQWEMDRRNNLRNAKELNKQDKLEKQQAKTVLQIFNPKFQKLTKLNNELSELHTEWKQTINDSNVNITQLKSQINVVNLQTATLLKETEKQYNDYILSIKNNSNKEIQNIRNEITNWETKLRESRSKWKTLKTQIENMKK